MKIGLYTFASLILITLIGVFAFTLHPEVIKIEMMGFVFEYSFAVWIILPMVILFIFSIGHMIFYGYKNYSRLKKWEGDAQILEDALFYALVNEPIPKAYKMHEIGEHAILLNKAKITLNDNVEGLSPRLAKVANVIQKIKNGEYVNLKEEKLSHTFKIGNPILVQNRVNRLMIDKKFVEEVLGNGEQFSQVVQDKALNIFASSVNFEEAIKYINVFDIKNFLVILNRVTPDDDLGLTIEILSEFLKKMKLSCADFIHIAEVTKQYLRPDENLSLFHTYQKENEKAQNAYLYLLFEYELLDQVQLFLDDEDEEDFTKFRLLYQLKKENNRCKLEDIINIRTICSESRFI